MRPSKKLRNVGPHKSILKKNDKQWKSHQENKKFRSVCQPTYGTTVNHNVNNILRNHEDIWYTRVKTGIHIHTGIPVHCFQ